MIGEQRPVQFDRNNIDQGEGRRENRDDLFDLMVVHSPKKPRMLLRMWPTMKANQTMKQKISVTAVRAESLAGSGRRHTSQYSGSMPRPIAMNCSLISNEPTAGNSRAFSM